MLIRFTGSRWTLTRSRATACMDENDLGTIAGDSDLPSSCDSRTGRGSSRADEASFLRTRRSRPNGHSTLHFRSPAAWDLASAGYGYWVQFGSYLISFCIHLKDEIIVTFKDCPTQHWTKSQQYALLQSTLNPLTQLPDVSIFLPARVPLWGSGGVVRLAW